MNSFAACLIAWAVNGALVAPIFMVVLSWVRRQDWIPPHWHPLVAGGGTALCGYAVFWIYFIWPKAGIVSSAVLVFECTAWLWTRRHQASPGSFFRSETAAVLLLVFGAGLSYLGALYLPSPVHSGPSYYERAADRFVQGLPGDDSLSHLFADAVYHGPSPRILLGDWLSSDRPPLQTGWILLTKPMTDVLGFEPMAASGTACVWMQLFWVAAVYGLLRALALRRATAAGVTAALAFTGFFLLHTVYTWPKLTAGALVCCAWSLTVLEDSEDAKARFRRFVLGGALAGLAWLAHGGVAFGLLAMAPWAVRDAWRGRWKLWAAACGMIVLLGLPWAAYQKYYAPPGNRLIKWHLAGQVSVDSRGFWQTLRENYAALGWKGALHNRIADLHWLVIGTWPNPFRPATFSANFLRGQEFYFLFRSANLWLLGAAALIVLVWDRKRGTSRQALGTLGAWSAFTLVVWVALMFQEHSTTVHQGPFTTPICLLCLWAIGLRLAGKAWFAGVFIVQAAMFACVWLPPSADFGAPWNWAALTAMLAGAAILLIFVARDLLKPHEYPGL